MRAHAIYLPPREHGWTVVSAEYRRRPGDPDASTADVAAALGGTPRLLAGKPYDGALIVVGHSAGGQLALWAASAVPTQALVGVVGLAPVADLRLAEELRLGNGAVADLLGGRPRAAPISTRSASRRRPCQWRASTATRTLSYRSS